MASAIRGAALRGSAFKPAVARRAGVPRAQQRRRLACFALDPSVAAAVTQQAVAYAVVLGAEAAFSYNAVPAGDQGRPQIPLVGAGIAGTIAAVALVSAGGDSPLASVGLGVGFLTSAAMLAVCVQRVLKLEFSDMDWPGPKAWPAGMALISFFALNVFGQAVIQQLSGSA